MPHVEVEVLYVPKPLKGIRYIGTDSQPAIAQRGDRFELDLYSALVQAKKGIVRIVGTSRAQAKTIAKAERRRKKTASKRRRKPDTAGAEG